MADERIIAAGDEFYFYREGVDDDVCLKLFGNFEYQASSKSVMIKIPPDIWEFIRKLPSMTFGLADKTDEELQRLVEAEVDAKLTERERQKSLKATKNKSAGNYFAIIKSLAYAASDEPREKQLEAGMEYYRNKRDRQKSVLEKMKGFRKASENPD